MDPVPGHTLGTDCSRAGHPEAACLTTIVSPIGSPHVRLHHQAEGLVLSSSNLTRALFAGAGGVLHRGHLALLLPPGSFGPGELFFPPTSVAAGIRERRWKQWTGD